MFGGEFPSGCNHVLMACTLTPQAILLSITLTGIISDTCNILYIIVSFTKQIFRHHSKLGTMLLNAPAKDLTPVWGCTCAHVNEIEWMTQESPHMKVLSGMYVTIQ